MSEIVDFPMRKKRKPVGESPEAIAQARADGRAVLLDAGDPAGNMEAMRRLTDQYREDKAAGLIPE